MQTEQVFCGGHIMTGGETPHAGMISSLNVLLGGQINGGVGYEASEILWSGSIDAPEAMSAGSTIAIRDDRCSNTYIIPTATRR